jgi:hypothetical protein
MPEPDYGVSLSAPTKSIKPKERTAGASKASKPKTSFMDKFKASVTGPPTAGAIAAQKEFMDNVGKSDDGPSAMQGGIASLNGATADADMYAENLKRYNEYMESQGRPVGGPMGGKGGPRTMPQQPEITPEMREAALGMFESQQGAGQVPYYMAAARNANNPNMSPAFQYAAQNYDVLGGSQRLAPRPMEMMSVAERNRINDMSQAMADQAAQQQMAQNEYQEGLTAGKGGPRTMPQPGGGQFSSMEQLMEFQQANPSMNLMGEYQRLQGLGGGAQTQPPMPQPGYQSQGGNSPVFASGLGAVLAKRFGNMG